ncbi:hypothetical protein V8D89_000709 [Ganoderma adspersum]
MRVLVLSVSRAALVGLFMAILRAHALAVIPPEALPETHRTLESDDAFSEPGPAGAVDVAPYSLPGSGSATSLPVSSVPTVTRVLPSHAPWHAQPGTTTQSPGGHAPGTQMTLDGRLRIHDADTEEHALHSYSYHGLNSAPWAAKHRESESTPRRRRPGGVGDDAADRERGTSDDSKVSVLAVAVVGVVLACHYLDYL